MSKKYFLSFLGCSHVGHSLPVKNRYRLADDIHDTLATHAGLTLDITNSNTDCCAHNGGTRSHALAASKHQF